METLTKITVLVLKMYEAIINSHRKWVSTGHIKLESENKYNLPLTVLATYGIDLKKNIV